MTPHPASVPSPLSWNLGGWARSRAVAILFFGFQMLVTPLAEAAKEAPRVVPPLLLKKVEPKLPKGAQMIPITLEARITASGDVENVKVLRSAKPELNEYYTTALKQYKYKPATLNGKPISVSLTVTETVQISAAVEPRPLEGDAALLIGAGRCADAIRMLETLEDQRRDEPWYHLCATANLMCGQGQTTSAFHKKAHAWLTAGVRRFPKAIQLRLDHGQIFLAEHAWQEAMTTFEEAKRLLQAQRHIQNDPRVQDEIRLRLRGVDGSIRTAREHAINDSAR